MGSPHTHAQACTRAHTHTDTHTHARTHARTHTHKPSPTDTHCFHFAHLNISVLSIFPMADLCATFNATLSFQHRAQVSQRLAVGGSWKANKLCRPFVLAQVYTLYIYPQFTLASPSLSPIRPPNSATASQAIKSTLEIHLCSSA